MGRPRKIRLEDMSQTDGKLDHAVPDGTEVIDGKLEPTNAPKIRSLDELTGFHKAKYKTLDESAYAAELKNMNKVDLEKHSVNDVGLLPNDNRAIMEERLLKAFRVYVAPYINAENIKAVQLEPTPEAMDILSQGANKIR